MFSFTKSKKTVELSPYVRRICDLTTPNNTSSPELDRVENRYNRSIPTLIVPWDANRPIVDGLVIGITRDIADHGIGLVLSEPFQADDVLLGFWVDAAQMSDPWFFLGKTRRCSAVGGGFWTLGVELIEFANARFAKEVELLRPTASKLLPPSDSMAG
jgi:hypothetical protein